MTAKADGAAYVCPGCGSANLSAEHPLDGWRVDCLDCGIDFHPSDGVTAKADGAGRHRLEEADRG